MSYCCTDEIFVFFVYSTRYYVMKHHVVEKILKLVRRKEKYLVVAAVRFLRTCVSLKVGFFGIMRVYLRNLHLH